MSRHRKRQEADREKEKQAKRENGEGETKKIREIGRQRKSKQNLKTDL